MEEDKTSRDEAPNPHTEGIGLGWAVLGAIAITVAVVIYITL